MRPSFLNFLLSVALLAGCHSQERERARGASASAAKARDESAPVKLYKEVKRLNAACVSAGGGVSGSPDCDAATAKEEQLERLGYCIDYPHNEKLAKCDEGV